jgi:hypothetical protein
MTGAQRTRLAVALVATARLALVAAAAHAVWLLGVAIACALLAALGRVHRLARAGVVGPELLEQ